MANHAFGAKDLKIIRNIIFEEISFSANWAPLKNNFQKNNIDKTVAEHMNARLKQSLDQISDETLIKFSNLSLGELDNGESSGYNEDWFRRMEKIGADSAPDTAHAVVEKFILDWENPTNPEFVPTLRRRAIRI